MLNFKKCVFNGLAGPYWKFLGMAMKKFGNFTRPNGYTPRTEQWHWSPPWIDSIIALGAGELLVRTLHPLSSSPRKMFMIWPEVYRTFQPIPTSNVILIYSKLSVLIQFLISFLLHEAKSISKQTIKLSFLRLSPVFLRYLQSVNILLPLHQTLVASI